MAQASVINAEKRILSLLDEKLMSTSALAKRLDMRREVVSGYMEALRHQGKVELIKIGRSNVYKPAKRKSE